ncbi:MAG: alpha/beta hydrolase family esterase [Acidimicrobiales bacterium]
MKLARLVALVAAIALAATACGGSGPVAGPGTGAGQGGGAGHIGARVAQLSFDGTTRSYRVYSPGAPTRVARLPLVVVLGGVGDNAQSMTNATLFDQEAGVGGFVVAYGEAAQASWSAGFCCAGPDSNAYDDVGYLNHLVDTVEADYPIDASRLYAVGVSAGAMMAYRWACADPARVAGVGSVAGAMVLDSCQPTVPVSVIEIHGTADPLVPFTGGAISPDGVATAAAPSSAALVQRWASLDTCPGTAAVQTAGVVTRSTWTGCARGSAVSLVAVQGGGHTWFAPGYGAVEGAVDATKEIWTFLSTHNRSSAGGTGGG